jgi:hypothetical protein
MPHPTHLSIAGVAERCGVTQQTVRNWFRSGVAAGVGRLCLRATRYGGNWRISERDLTNFLEAVTTANLPIDLAIAGPSASRASQLARAEAAGKELERMGA